MGTTCVSAYGSSAREIIERNFVNAMVPGDVSGFKFEYLTQKGNIFYGVMRREDRHTGEFKHFGIVIKTSMHREPSGAQEFCYKDMTEDMGPCYYDAPRKMLDMLDKLAANPAGHAAEWRAKCRSNCAAQADKAKVVLQMNDRVEYDGQVYVLLETAGPRRGWRVRHEQSGTIYRMNAKQIHGSKKLPAKEAQQELAIAA